MRAVRALPVVVCALAASALAACNGADDKRPVETDLFASRQGQTVAFFDLDGDGLLDKLVGAPQAVRDGAIGVVLVYRGRTAGFATEPSWQLTGGKSFGTNMQEVGDVDGDGRVDLAVGAVHGPSPEAGLAGAVEILAGGGGGRRVTTLGGLQPFARFGHALASCDLDGDGARELIVGAPFHSPSPDLFQAGAVYVFSGALLATRAALDATSANKGLGWAVACGDFTGDGLADLLLGASGKVLGFYGAPGFAPSLAAPDLTVTSGAADFGRSLLVGPDVDGDGVAELVLGAPKAKIGNDRDVGSVYVVRGGAGPRAITLGATPPADLVVRLDGKALFSRFGAALALTADIDADGKPELAVGAPYEDCTHDGKDMFGRVYLFPAGGLATSTLDGARSFDGGSHHGGFGTVLVAGPGALLAIGAPRVGGDTGALHLLDVATGAAVPGGSTGGVTGTPIDETPHDHDGHGESH